MYKHKSNLLAAILVAVGIFAFQLVKDQVEGRSGDFNGTDFGYYLVVFCLWTLAVFLLFELIRFFRVPAQRPILSIIGFGFFLGILLTIISHILTIETYCGAIDGKSLGLDCAFIFSYGWPFSLQTNSNSAGLNTIYNFSFWSAVSIILISLLKTRFGTKSIRGIRM